MELLGGDTTSTLSARLPSSPPPPHFHSLIPISEPRPSGMKTDQQHSFVSACLHHTHLLTTDKIGSNVVYLCISHFTTGHTLGIVDMLTENCVGIVKDRHGCHVLQECFRKYATGQSILRSFLDSLISDVVNLASHAYGNYVNQCLMMMNIPHGISLVVSHIMDYIVELSMDNNHFLDVLRDAVGNYVAQRAIVTAWEVK
ncbi:Pumilio domain-containing protein, partial [Drosera capensis]